MKRKHLTFGLTLLLLFLALFGAGSGEAAVTDVIRNGNFTNGLNEWVLNPALTGPEPWPLQSGQVNLHPANPAGYTGTVISQTLDVVGIGGRTFVLSLKLTKIASLQAGNTVAVYLTYGDSITGTQRVLMTNPANAIIAAATPVVGVYGFGSTAQTLTKIEIVKTGQGEGLVDDIALTYDPTDARQIPIPATATGGANLTLTASGHPPMGFGFKIGQVAPATGDFMITGYGGNAPPYWAYGFLQPGISLQDLGVKTLDAVTEIPSAGYAAPPSIDLVDGHAYAFRLAGGSYGILAVKSVTLNLPEISMVFDYKYLSGPTISFLGSVKTAPNWPSMDGMAAVAGAIVNAMKETGPSPFSSAMPDSSTGTFTVSEIPAASTFYLTVSPPPGYMPVISKYMNWMDNIQALLPFSLFTAAPGGQYASFGNTPGTGMILGRIALKNSPTTFLAGATVEAREYIPGAPPALGATYPVTYTSGSATGTDGIYMVKSVPAGKMVQLVATLANHAFEFNGAVIPVQAGFVSEESFFGTAGSCSYGLDSSSASAAWTGSGGTVAVTASAGCAWTATSNNADWLHVTAPGTGSGPGSFSYTADANAGAARTGTITVGGQTFTVNQGAVVVTPSFAVDILNPTLKVIKGQKAEFILKSSFYNGFTTAGGIGLQLQESGTPALADKATFLPLPIKGDGGVVLKIDTTNLAAGTYPATILTNDGGTVATAGTISLQVVTVSDIRFFELDNSTTPATRTDLTAKTATKQGQIAGLQAEVIGSDGQTVTNPDLVLTSDNPWILGVYKRFWGYEIYAAVNGGANLTATAPDGTVRTLPVTVNFPTASWVSWIGLSPATVANNRTAPIVWSAQGTTSLGWIGTDTSGIMNFQTDFLDKLARSQDGRSASSSFTLLNQPTDIGTAILYAETQDGLAKAVIPLTTVNAPGTGQLAFFIRNLDPSAFAEMFQLLFYGTDNQLKFTRDVFAIHAGSAPVLVGNIPPGSYKLLFVPGNTGVKPRWWPNGTDISGAATVAFTADGTTGNIYFFAQSEPAGSSVTLPQSSRTFDTAAAGTGTVTVNATAGASWAAVSNAAWITITSGATGTGTGTFSFAVAANPSPGVRSGTITVNGSSYTVTQAGLGAAHPVVGTWGVASLQYDNINHIWYTEATRIALSADGTGTLKGTKNDGVNVAGQRIKAIDEAFTYTIEANADGSYNLVLSFGGTAVTRRIVLSDNGNMVLMDGVLDPAWEKLTVMTRIDTGKTYAVSDLAGEYYSIGFESNVDGIADPPNGNGRFMAISSIHNFSGAGTYTYAGKANSVFLDGHNAIWDDNNGGVRNYTVNPDGTVTSGSGAFFGGLSGNGKVLAGTGSYLSDNWVGYCFMKKQDKNYATADLAGKWAVVSFGQDSSSASPGFDAQIGTLTCDAAGHCGFQFRYRWSGDGSTNINSGSMTIAVAPDGSFGASLPGGTAPAYAGAIGNDGNTIFFNTSFNPAQSWHREIFIGIRASNIGDLAGGPSALKGDLNADAQVNLSDAILALQAASGMNPGSIRANYATSGADVNGDNRIGLAEVLYILQTTAGLR